MSDIELYCTERGEGFPLVLLHGNGESSDYFAAQLEFFSRRFRVIAADTRGHGRSPRGSAPFTLCQFADDLKALLDSLGIKKAHLLGFSDGGNIALLFALKYPQYIEKLVLNGANLSDGGVKLIYQLPVWGGFALLRAISLFDKRAVAKKELLGLMVGQPDIRPEELGALKMPVLVIAGTKDMIRDSHTRLIASSIPGARLVLLEGNHFIAARRSSKFNAAVDAFL